MRKLYVAGGAVSTEPPAQPIRQIPAVTVDHARLFATRCATYQDLRTRSPLFEQNPDELYRRVGERLSGAEHAVYGIVRQARRLNFAGARVSHVELGLLIGRHESTCRRAVAVLEALELLRVVPQFRDGGAAAELGYDRSQTRNAYALGALAKEPRVLPGLGGAPPPRKTHRTEDKTPRKTATLSDGRSEPLQGSDSPSCLPSTGSTGPETRGEVPTSSADRRLTPPSMPAAPAAEQRLPNEKSKVRTTGLTAPLGDVAKFSRQTRQDDRGAQEADADEDWWGLAPRTSAALGGAP